MMQPHGPILSQSFEKQHLKHWVIRGKNVFDSSFTHCKVDNVRVYGASLSNVQFDSCQFVGAAGLLVKECEVSRLTIGGKGRVSLIGGPYEKRRLPTDVGFVQLDISNHVGRLILVGFHPANVVLDPNRQAFANRAAILDEAPELHVARVMRAAPAASCEWVFLHKNPGDDEDWVATFESARKWFFDGLSPEV